MRFAIPFLALPLLLGCTGSHVDDSGIALQDSFRLDLLGPPQEAINSPYVTGAAFTVDVVANGYATQGWRLTSSDPTVIAVGGSLTSSLDFPVTALHPGHATLSVVDSSGKVLHAHDVDVDQPDRVELHSHGLMLGGLPDAQTQVSSVNIVTGGTATLLVRYFKGSQELWGNGAVTTSATGPISGRTIRSTFGDERDWIAIDANADGSAQVTLSVAGSELAAIPVSVVAYTTVTRVSLLAQSEGQAQDGQSLSIFARATDAQGQDVYGSNFAWYVEGATGSATSATGGGPSDTFSYVYKGSSSETVTASADDQTSNVTVHGDGGTVGSSATVACAIAGAPGSAAAGGAVGWGAGGAAAGVLALVVARRRRRAQPGQAMSLRQAK